MFIFEAESNSLKNNRTIGSVTLPCIITYVHYLLNVAWWFYEKKTTHFLFYLLLRLFLKVRITDIVYTCPSHNFSIVLRIAYYIIVFTKKRGQEEGHRLTSVLKNVNNRFQGKNYVTHFRTYPSEYFRIGHTVCISDVRKRPCNLGPFFAPYKFRLFLYIGKYVIRKKMLRHYVL